MATIYDKYELSCDNPRDRANVVIPGFGGGEMRDCRQCGNPLPLGSTPRRVYCSIDCRLTAQEEAKAQRMKDAGR